MNKLILVDVDGVVLQWGWAFGEYIKNEGLVPDDHLIRPAYKVEKILNITRDIPLSTQPHPIGCGNNRRGKLCDWSKFQL